jgi:dTDP-4-dehydrorhamnose reductase
MTPLTLANWAKKTGALFIHYSTDYVFRGQNNTPSTELDETKPINVYGKTKLAADRAIMQLKAKHLIFRTSWVYSPWGHNFPNTILGLVQNPKNLKINDDQIGSPTSADLIASMTRLVIERYLNHDTCPFGLYHLTCQGETSWYNYASYLINKALKLGFKLNQNITLEPIYGPDPSRAALRPLNSRLDCTKFTQTFGVKLPPWEEEVDKFLLILREKYLE